MKLEIQQHILKLKKEKNALILAHNYQIDEVQDIADFVGDSFGLSKQAASTNQDVIVFCGVHFMAEVASILAPEKTVLLPEPSAGCPLASMISVDALREAKIRHPKAMVVCYINSSAEIKAESDICCTSANAVKVVNSLPANEILFVPDGNLAHWVAKHSTKKIIPWQGNCPIHHRVLPGNIDRARGIWPGVPVAVHPECHPDVVSKADFVGSTGAILAYVRESNIEQVIIGTERGILHRLELENPDKKFYLLSPNLICADMKYTTLEKVLASLENMETEVTVPEGIRNRARVTLEKMLTVV